jgi:hypothetical protein
MRNLALIPAIVWVSLVATAALEARRHAAGAAVVTAADVMARAADSVRAPPRFSQPLPSGTEVNVIERRDRWSRILLSDGRDAWVPGSAIELVSGG